MILLKMTNNCSSLQEIVKLDTPLFPVKEIESTEKGCKDNPTHSGDGKNDCDRNTDSYNQGGWRAICRNSLWMEKD